MTQASRTARVSEDRARCYVCRTAAAGHGGGRWRRGQGAACHEQERPTPTQAAARGSSPSQDAVTIPTDGRCPQRWGRSGGTAAACWSERQRGQHARSAWTSRDGGHSERRLPKDGGWVPGSGRACRDASSGGRTWKCISHAGPSADPPRGRLAPGAARAPATHPLPAEQKPGQNLLRGLDSSVQRRARRGHPFPLAASDTQAPVHPAVCTPPSELLGPPLTSTCHPDQVTLVVPVCPLRTDHQPVCRNSVPGLA